MTCWICTLCRVYLAPVVTQTIRTGICKEALIRKIQKSESFGRGSTKKAAPLGVPEQMIKRIERSSFKSLTSKRLLPISRLIGYAIHVVARMEKSSR